METGEALKLIETARQKHGAVTANVIETLHWRAGSAPSARQYELWFSIENRHTQIFRGNTLAEISAQLCLAEGTH